jgi:hypothetical protein
MKDTGLYQVTLPYACFGIEVRNGVVTSSAPIGKWMVGKNFVYVAEWVSKKRGNMRKTPRDATQTM